MNSKIYFIPKKNLKNEVDISRGAKFILDKIVKEENIHLSKNIPLKVHFGEKGNKTFIPANNYDGIVDYLQEKGIKSSFIETNVLYSGQRMTKENHIKLAIEHKFTKLPIIIADGDIGTDYNLVQIYKKNFKHCKIGSRFSDFSQMIVLSHFKGHILAGFGGAIKNLAMGCAARGGKLDQHANSTPKINESRCSNCHICHKKCPVDAINIEDKDRTFIVEDKCIGCAACIAVCPIGAVAVNWEGQLDNQFLENVTEYAYGAQKLFKNNIFINFALTITKSCDCDGSIMTPIVDDLGIFAGTDPVAIDKACQDLLEKREKKKIFRGDFTFDYAEEIGLGSKKYELVEIDKF